MLWDPFLYCINDSIQGNSETGNKVFVLPSKVAINTIANSLCCSRNTVSEVLKLAETHSLEWPIPETLTNRDIGHLFYPGRGNNEGRRLPDYEYVYNELAKPGVTLSLLWAEYCAKCEAGHTIPYQHSQFNDKYHAYAASKKATLRIKRKPGETMEVDWL